MPDQVRYDGGDCYDYLAISQRLCYNLKMENRSVLVDSCEILPAKSPEIVRGTGARELTPLMRALELKKEAGRKLAYYDEAMAGLAAVRYELFPNAALTIPDNERHLPLDERLYGDPTYDAAFIRNLLDLRSRGDRGFHEESEKYGSNNSKSGDDERRNHAYRMAIMQAGIKLGFIKDIDTAPTNPEHALGVSTTELSQLTGDVEAIIIPAAASISNPIRLVGALRALESGELTTNQIIITACDRPVSEQERAKVEKVGFQAGDSEFESCLLAAEDLLGPIDWLTDELEPPYPHDTPTKRVYATILVSGRPVTMSVISAPTEPGRMVNEKPAQRTDTTETFRAAYELLGDGPLVIMSHDTWINGQEAIGLQTFLLENGNPVTGVGPYKTDRIIDGDITAAEGVVDEMAKTYELLMTAWVLAETAIVKELLKPIPNQNLLRQQKASTGYRHLPINSRHEKYNETIVSLRDYGVAGQSYYSRPNATTTDSVPGVSPETYTRKSVAEALQRINKVLSDPTIAALFGGAVELYVEEGLRSTDVQGQLYYTFIPDLITAQSPSLSGEEVASIRDQMIARPSNDGSPSPHATGGAVDVRLRYKPEGEWTPDYIPGSFIDMGHEDGEVSERTHPEYFETHSNAQEQPSNNRRVLYNLMTQIGGFSVNPSEWWHYDLGNQLHAMCSGETAYYAEAPTKTTTG